MTGLGRAGPVGGCRGVVVVRSGCRAGASPVRAGEAGVGEAAAAVHVRAAALVARLAVGNDYGCSPRMMKSVGMSENGLWLVGCAAGLWEGKGAPGCFRLQHLHMLERHEEWAADDSENILDWDWHEY